MIYELRTYTLSPGKQGEYLKLNSEVGRPIRGDKYGKLEGSWTTEFGTLNQYVHLWAYRDLNDRAAVRGKTLQDPEWQAFLAKATPLLVEMRSIALVPAPSSPMK